MPPFLHMAPQGHALWLFLKADPLNNLCSLLLNLIQLGCKKQEPNIWRSSISWVEKETDVCHGVDLPADGSVTPAVKVPHPGPGRSRGRMLASWTELEGCSGVSGSPVLPLPTPWCFLGLKQGVGERSECPPWEAEKFCSLDKKN